MIHAAGEGFYDAFHFELEEEGCELSDGDAGLDADDVELQIVGLLEQTDDLLFIRCQIGEERTFDTI